MNAAGEVAAAAVGTVAFSLIFGVPKKFYPYCGLIGGAGWLVYALLYDSGICTAAEATFLATVLVVILSRFFAVREKCPVTVFLISGIFPLVPGAGIYWTAYYLVTDQLALSLATGFDAVKAAVAIVLAIVIVFELPYRFFRLAKRRRP